MRIFILGVSAIFTVSVAACAQKAPPAVNTGVDISGILAWSHSCDSYGKECWLEKLVHFNNDSGAGNGGLVIDYIKSDRTLRFISVLVPRDAAKSAEVVIRFISSVKKNGRWKMVPDKSGFLGLPIMACDSRFCQARVHAQIIDGPNLLAEMENRGFVWVMFERKRSLVRFMVPLDGVHGDLRKLDLKLTSHRSGQR